MQLLVLVPVMPLREYHFAHEILNSTLTWYCCACSLGHTMLLAGWTESKPAVSCRTQCIVGGSKRALFW